MQKGIVPLPWNAFSEGGSTDATVRGITFTCQKTLLKKFASTPVH